ncbi:MAG: response regulator [Rhodospirillaceae bacterium]|nr:response regulator [Rhodospirillaceae bacterium]
MARILVIDDDPLVAATFKIMLAKQNHEPVAAGSCHLALQKLSLDRFDMAFCDMIMPDVEGLETINRIRKIDPTMPIIAMSGGGRTGKLDFLQIAKKAGANDILRKPFSAIALTQVIDAHINPA